jgi:ribosomal protein S18 acetylase RimI-like enzyme
LSIAPKTTSVPKQVEFRLAKASDLSELYQVFVEIVGPFELYNLEARTAELKKYAPDKLLQLLEADTDSLIVASSEDRIVGFAIIRPDDGPIWLCWFGTLPQCRKKGIGTGLINEVIARARARNAQKIWCDTRVENFASIAILEGLGFEKKCLLRNHWFNQDYIIWERFI